MPEQEPAAKLTDARSSSSEEEPSISPQNSPRKSLRDLVRGTVAPNDPAYQQGAVVSVRQPQQQQSSQALPDQLLPEPPRGTLKWFSWVQDREEANRVKAIREAQSSQQQSAS
jgi:hypothetical protein